MEALPTQLRLIDVVRWQRIATWVEQSELSFEHVRAVAVSERADVAGFPQQGKSSSPLLDAARREGIQAYVDTLDREERGRLLNAFANAR